MNPEFYSRKKNNSSPIIDKSEGLKSQESSFADQTKKSREQSELIDSSSSNQKVNQLITLQRKADEKSKDNKVLQLVKNSPLETLGINIQPDQKVDENPNAQTDEQVSEEQRQKKPMEKLGFGRFEPNVGTLEKGAAATARIRENEEKTAKEQRAKSKKEHDEELSQDLKQLFKYLDCLDEIFVQGQSIKQLYERLTMLNRMSTGLTSASMIVSVPMTFAAPPLAIASSLVTAIPSLIVAATKLKYKGDLKSAEKTLKKSALGMDDGQELTRRKRKEELAKTTADSALQVGSAAEATKGFIGWNPELKAPMAAANIDLAGTAFTFAGLGLGAYALKQGIDEFNEIQNMSVGAILGPLYCNELMKNYSELFSRLDQKARYASAELIVKGKERLVKSRAKASKVMISANDTKLYEVLKNLDS